MVLPKRERRLSHDNAGAANQSVLKNDMTARIQKPKNLNALKEWKKVKHAWGGDVEAWQRYSGLKLPEGELV